MIVNIMKVAEMLDSSDKIERKIQVVDVCYDIMDAVFRGSRKEEASQNVLVIEKIVEKLVKDLDASNKESISAESFIKSIYSYLYKVDFAVTPDALLKVKVIENGYANKMNRTTYASIIDLYDDLDLLDKLCLTVVCKEYEACLGEGAYSLLGPRKGEEILADFVPKSFCILKNSLDEAMIDDEMTIDELVAELHHKFSKTSKDIFLEKYSSGSINLNNCALAKLFAGKSKKEIIPVFVSDIYERTTYINEEDSDEEFVKDCCDLLNISEEEYEKSMLLPGKVSYLKLTRLMRQLNSKKEEE